MQEVWKDVFDYEGLYQVSNTGKIRSIRGGTVRERSIAEGPDKYCRVILQKDGTRKSHYVHRLVATAFIPSMSEDVVVNHKDCDPRNNNVDNLEWCTQQHNATYGNAVQKRSKPVQMLDPDTGEILRTFYGVREAGREMGLHFPNIIHACSGEHRTSGGYKWRYKEE